jgi:hypothetical protein
MPHVPELLEASGRALSPAAFASSPFARNVNSMLLAARRFGVFRIRFNSVPSDAEVNKVIQWY